MNNIAAVLFDMDGVIVDSMGFHAEAWKTVLKRSGLRLDDTEILRREGMSGKDSVLDIFREHGLACPTDDEYAEIIEQKHLVFEKNSISIFPAVKTILSFIKKNGINLGLVTGSLKRSVDHVLPLNILNEFNAVVTADDVIKGKPDPEPYEKGLEMLGVQSKNAVVIENAPLGILSAKRAGAVCYAVKTTLPEEYLFDADVIFENHDELYSFLKKELSPGGQSSEDDVCTGCD